MQDLPQPSEPDAPSVPAQHRAPGADTRPRSRLALLSVVLAVGLSVLAFVLDLAWPLIVLAFVVAVVAALRIRPQEQRGQGWIFLAIVITILTGGYTLFGTLAFRDMASQMTHGVLTGAASEGTTEELEARVAKWFTTDAIAADAPADVLRRYRELAAEMGPYAGEVHLPSVFRGLGGVLEKELPESDGTLGALWTEAVFRDGAVRVQLVLSRVPMDELWEASSEQQKGRAMPLLADVRFHRDR